MISHSLSEDHFDADCFDLAVDLTVRCPIKGCPVQSLSRILRGKKTFPYCEIHGLELHPTSRTFVYCNGEDAQSRKQARLRNFRCRPEFVNEWVLDNPGKAETHRLGHETSEDALSWNVFVPLLEAGRLEDALRWFLQGHLVSITREPELYLWGGKVDLPANRFEPFPLLLEARGLFEPHKEVRRFPTEPDIMLVTDGLIMCIEAKFTSGNPLAMETETAGEGDKPKSRAGLLRRYMERWPGSERYLDRRVLEQEPHMHSQLFRNIIFAAWMAEQQKKDWHVVSLTSATQWGKQTSQQLAGYDFTDPTPTVRRYFKPGYQDHFTFCTWEGLHRDVIRGQPDLEPLSSYLKGKTAHLRQAFDLTVQANED